MCVFTTIFRKWEKEKAGLGSVRGCYDDECMDLGVSVVNGFKANRNGKINHISAFSQRKARASREYLGDVLCAEPRAKAVICLGAFSDSWYFLVILSDLAVN